MGKKTPYQPLLIKPILKKIIGNHEFSDMNCHAVLAIKSSLPITTTTKNSAAVHLPDIHVQLLEEDSPGVFAHAYPD